MRSVLILSLALGAAGVAQAQIQPPKNPYAISPPTIGSTQSNGSFKPYEPPKLPSVYADGPFSPGGEAKRERKAEAAERARTNGPFSPEGEAKRERAQAKHNAAINPF
jgi:hypothetical protein